MKRKGNLIAEIASYDNLYLAFFKARKSKDEKEEVIEYRKDLKSNILQLQKSILSGDIEIGNYHFFTIYEPKERQICAAPFSDRVLHHALMNICHPIFENAQIYDSYATREGKGTYAALERAECFHKKNKWYLKLDVRKYFDSIDQDVLYSQLQRKFKDRKLMHIFKIIIESYQSDKGKGLPIGNLTSQYFANYYLSFLDHFIKDTLRVKGYVRYMDDLVLWSNSKDELLKYREKVIDFLNSELLLKLKINIVNSNSHGLSFLGYRIYQSKILLQKGSKKRFVMKAKRYEMKLNNSEWSQYEYQQHILPLIAYVRHADTRSLRQSTFKNIG